MIDPTIHQINAENSARLDEIAVAEEPRREQLRQWLNQIVADKDVLAIVIDLDSPGGEQRTQPGRLDP